MSSDPRKDADEYLASKKVMELFHDLGQKMLYTKPEDPNAFLLVTLKDHQESQNRGVKSSFFTAKDVETMYRMFDPTSSGSISVAQYNAALQSLGVDAQTVAVEGDRVTKEQFEKNMKAELEALSLTG